MHRRSKLVVNKVFEPSIVPERVNKSDPADQANADNNPDDQFDPVVQPSWFFRPENDFKGWERIPKTLYNSEKGEFLLRTPKSWFQIILFYVGYYGFLIGFWFIMLAIFYTTLDDETPKLTLEHSRIGINPGLGLRPYLLQENSDKMSEQKYSFFEGNISREDRDITNDYIKNIQQFLNETSNLEGNSEYADCNVTGLIITIIFFLYSGINYLNMFPKLLSSVEFSSNSFYC